MRIGPLSCASDSLDVAPNVRPAPRVVTKLRRFICMVASLCFGSVAELVFDNGSALDDERHVLTLAGQEREVLEWIALHRDEIRECAGTDAADLAREAQHARRVERGGADHL